MTNTWGAECVRGRMGHAVAGIIAFMGLCWLRSEVQSVPERSVIPRRHIPLLFLPQQDIWLPWAQRVHVSAPWALSQGLAPLLCQGPGSVGGAGGLLWAN